MPKKKQPCPATITNSRAKEAFAKLCMACEKRPDGLTDAVLFIITDYAQMEQMKQELLDDVRARGAVVEYHNGRQRGKTENKSLQQARMLMEQQRKHLNELKVTPASNRLASIPMDDGFDGF